MKELVDGKTYTIRYPDGVWIPVVYHEKGDKFVNRLGADIPRRKVKKAYIWRDKDEPEV